MKRVIRLLSTFLLATSLFAMISCSNDSVDNSAPAPQPETKPNENVIKDGTYEVTLTPNIDATTFNEVELNNNKIVVTEGKLIPLLGAKSKIEKCKIGNGEYFNYSFEIPKELKDKLPKGVIGKGIVLAKNKIADKKMNIIVSDGGKKFTYDWNKIDFLGSNIKILTLEVLSLTNAQNQSILFRPYNPSKIKDYVGTWEHEANKALKYTLVINEDLTGSYSFGTITGELIIDDELAWGLELIDKTSKQTIGNVAKLFEKLTFTPVKGFEGTKESVSFTKQKTEIKK